MITFSSPSLRTVPEVLPCTRKPCEKTVGEKTVGTLPPVPLLRSLRRSSALRLLWTTITGQVHFNLAVLKVWFAASPAAVSWAMINEVAVGHDVLGSGSEVLNLAIHRSAS